MVGGFSVRGGGCSSGVFSTARALVAMERRREHCVCRVCTGRRVRVHRESADAIMAGCRIYDTRN